jgi:HD-like signal output (HDOD) protein
MSKPEFPAVDLEKVLAVEHLPAMPQTAIRLLEMSADPSQGPAEFALPIEADPGLTVQVLRFVNSSFFGFRDQISSVKRAITMVGMRTVKNFVLWSAVFSMIPNPRCGLFDLKGLWQDSLRRALFARTLSRLLGLSEAEETFAAALLQDMAVPLLAKEVPDAYAKLFDARQRSHNRVRLSQLETYAFGWHHATAAGIAARQWHLPETLSALVEDHLSVEQHLARGEAEPGKLAVGLSALLPAVDDPEWFDFPKFESFCEQVRPLDGPTLEKLLDQVDQEFAEIAPLLRIPMPRVPLVANYHQVVASARN